MKRYGNLWERILSKENALLAIRKASTRSKRVRPEKRALIRHIKDNPDSYADELIALLRSGKYSTPTYYIYPLYEPKLRIIYTLPFFPHRIVHHMIMNVLEPIWENQMVEDSYACRKGKGQHKGGQKAMQYVCKYKYCLQCDISQFYINLDHAVLKSIIRNKIKDSHVLNLLDSVIDASSTRDLNLTVLYRMKERGDKNIDITKGIKKLEYAKAVCNGAPAGVPIGNYLSQWEGNLYMSVFDRYVKENLRCKAYIRYCDDFVLFSDSKEELHEWRKKIITFLWDKLKLTLSKTSVFPTSRGLDYLGYRYFPKGYILLRKKTAKTLRHRLKELAISIENSNIDPMLALSTVASAKGWMKYANSYNFRTSIGFDSLDYMVRKACNKLTKEHLMRGYPKNLNTKFDYLFVKDNFPRDKWEKDFKALLETTHDWFFVSMLATKEEGIEDDTHKIVEDTTKNTFAQYEYRENPQCKLYTLGFTRKEVENIILGL